MAIDLNKGAASVASQQAPTSALGTPSDSGSAIRLKVSQKIFDYYCDSNLRNEFIDYAVNSLGMQNATAVLAVDMEVESAGFTNEARLIEELTSMLLRFTDKDKKLDVKEKSDAIQMVCRPRTGYQHGLKVDIAEKRVIDFCRAHQVKVKVGMFRWDIP